MKELCSEVAIGPGEDMTIFQEVQFGDEVVVSQEGDSVLFPWLYELMGLFVGENHSEIRRPFNPGFLLGTDDNARPQVYITDRSSYNYTPYQSISSLSGSDPITIGTSGSFDPDVVALSDPGDMVQGVSIIGVQGNDTLLGYHGNVTWIDSTTVEVSGVSTNGSEDISRAYAALMIDKSYIDIRVRRSVFSNPQIVLGRDGTASDINQYVLNDLIPQGQGDNQLQYNAVTLNAPNVNLDQQISTISISREVDNQGSVEIPVRELALFTEHHWPEYTLYDAHVFELVSRDTLNTSVPSGSVISFTYKFRTSSEDSGGIMTNFNEMFYRQLSGGSRTVQDINNQDQNHGPSLTQFNVIARDGFLDRLTGVQVGTSTQVVDEADVSLINRVPYGEGDGELFPVGSWVDEMVVDEANSQAYFQVNKIFENRGSTSIDLNEMGLYTNGPSGPVMIFRHQLGSTQTVAAGENIKATYQVSVTV